MHLRPRAATSARRPTNGFTLIELMVVVAIIGLLAAMAYPAYTASSLKGRRAEGRAALTDLLQQQERYLTQANTYLAFAAGAAGTPFKTYSGDNQAKAAYLIGAQACPGAPAPALTECVRLFAIPNVTDADAGTLRVTSAGVKDCTGSKPDVCWK